ncbi:hypothetical protein BD311DRAFT_751553 [Dichomitus squalens]|uniref:Uncharacterized protein n=1 Tax=Dichomitus squalens TaxID=114155 RepID=A0A4Q9MWH0_9APHY|nr:hypothetical protein BD311DRAFT_751553 [Dichomitus squalens]
MMASRLARRGLFQSVRPAARVSARPTAPAARRFATTNAGHAAKESSDTAWQIGSALVFGPIIAYLLIGSGKKSSHAAESHDHSQPAQHADPEPSAEKGPSDVQQAEDQAIAADSPKDAQAAEEAEAGSAASEDGKVHGAPAITDDDGNTASSEEIKDSFDKAFKANIPEDAEREEARQASSGEKQPSEDKPASQAEGQTKDSQSEGGEQPTDIGEARQQAQSEKAPKQAAEDSK